MMSVPDLLGFVGVALIVGSYALSQLGRLSVSDPRYPAANALGAALIIVSLAFAFNAAAFAIEAFWLLISLIGLARALKGAGH